MRRNLVLFASSVALVGAVAFGLPGVDPGEGAAPLSVASLADPTGAASGFKLCLCPICTQIRASSAGAEAPIHITSLGLV